MAKRKSDSESPELEDDRLSAGEAADELASAGADEGDVQSGAEETSSEEQAPPPSWRDQAKEHGLDLSSFEDDTAAFKALAEERKSIEAARLEAQQAKQLAQYGQEFLPYASEFRSFMEQRQKQAQEKPVDPYARPEYDPRWESMVEYDENGILVPNHKNGGTPEIVQKVQNVLNWQRGFIREPDKYLSTFVKSQVEEGVKTHLEQFKSQELEQMRAQIAAEQFIITNDKWLFDRDKDGQHVYVQGQDGRPVKKLSDEGQFYSQALSQASQAGFNSQQQEFYAGQQLAMYRQMKAASSAPKKSAAEKKDDFLKQAAGHGAQPAASTHAPLRSSDPPQNTNHSYADLLRSAFAESGIDDRTFAG